MPDSRCVSPRFSIDNSSFFFFSMSIFLFFFFFFFNDTATTEIYTLSLHDALPISASPWSTWATGAARSPRPSPSRRCASRSEEHTSELQSPYDLVCRLLLEKKKKKKNIKKQIHNTTQTNTTQQKFHTHNITNELIV